LAFVIGSGVSVLIHDEVQKQRHSIIYAFVRSHAFSDAKRCKGIRLVACIC
jgi:hypothetical protein